MTAINYRQVLRDLYDTHKAVELRSVRGEQIEDKQRAKLYGEETKVLINAREELVIELLASLLDDWHRIASSLELIADGHVAAAATDSF